MDDDRSAGLTGDWDSRISRRTLLRTGGSAAACMLLLTHEAAAERPRPPYPENPFSLGVASGDPAPDGMVLWTRLAPDPLRADGAMPPHPYAVRYEIAADEGFRRIVQHGAALAVKDEVHAVHAEITGLAPATEYWYRFKFGPVISPAGRTRTAPAPGSSPEGLRFAYVSCQNWTDGYFHAYADLAEQRDVELVVHLGDYIYEGPGLRAGVIRGHWPAVELMSLNDYRMRHAQYRTDPALQRAHAAAPWLMTWDDHEFEDNYANLARNPGDPIGDIRERRAAAYLAYWEHAPLARSRKPVGKDLDLFRRTAWGDLATFHVLDTRQYRDDQTAETCPAAERIAGAGYCALQFDPQRTILGATQRQWLLDGLAAAPPGWNVIANQVGFAPQSRRVTGDPQRRFDLVDSWDGYVADRELILDLLQERSLTGTVVITGDKHRNSVRNVAADFRDPAGPAVATEFIGTSISSGGATVTPPPLSADNPHILFDDLHRGYVRVDVGRDVWRTEFRVVDNVTDPVPRPAWPLASWVVERGQPGAVPAGV